MHPFSFHVPSSHYRRRPSVRLAVTHDRAPFASPWLAFMAALARMVKP